MEVVAIAIWIVTILVVALVIVPVAVALLGRTLAAARASEAYLLDMLTAGAKIAEHTGAIPALDDTLALAAAMKPVAADIEAKTAAVASLLSGRALKART
jgi:hypothetical protein